MTQKLSQPDIIAVFDQALYAKVLEVQWKTPVLFKAIIPRMGAFHIACAFLAVLGADSQMLAFASCLWSHGQ